MILSRPHAKGSRSQTITETMNSETLPNPSAAANGVMLGAAQPTPFLKIPLEPKGSAHGSKGSRNDSTDHAKYEYKGIHKAALRSTATRLNVPST